MNYCIHATKESAYSRKNILSDISELEMIRGLIHRMRDMSDAMSGRPDKETIAKYEDHNGFATSHLKGRHLFETHIALMDIDHEDFKDQTIAKLDKKGIAYELICSSDGHYWVIADYVGKFNDVHNFINMFVGVDVKYIQYAKAKKVMTLRAFPQKGQVPTFEGMGSNKCGSTDFRNFVQEFKDYWKEPHIEWMVTEYQVNMI